MILTGSRCLFCSAWLIMWIVGGCNWQSEKVDAKSSDSPQDTHTSGRLGITELSTDGLSTDTSVASETSDISDSTVATAGTCGDGTVDINEACDDGNQEGNDYCAADCSYIIEELWPKPCDMDSPWPCYQILRCGDGVATIQEVCDDGNLESGDGCSPYCQVEIGWACNTESPSNCTPTFCGDGEQEGAETCDDENAMPFDGCSPICLQEPDCSQASCLSQCGDGVVLAEECDDGNNLYGDGCSDMCFVEDGFICSSFGFAEAMEQTIDVNVIYREFSSSHPDFDVSPCVALGTGVGTVMPQLENWKPIASQAFTDSCVSHFAYWYSDEHPSDSTVVQTLRLYANSSGQFSNHFGTDGDAFVSPEDETPAFFTSEIHYWFVYDAAAQVDLTFGANDDVWVFVNGRVALDMGGVQETQLKTLTIDETSQTAFALEDGQSYRISIFHASRSNSPPSLQISLGPNSIARSECRAFCGDGIVSIGEECDDGINDSFYGGCTPDCKLSSYCGDGILQEEYEDCDPQLDSSCPSSCRRILI